MYIKAIRPKPIAYGAAAPLTEFELMKNAKKNVPVNSADATCNARTVNISPTEVAAIASKIIHDNIITKSTPYSYSEFDAEG